MKKNYFLTIALLLAITVNSQEYLSEDFDSGFWPPTWPPTGWTTSPTSQQWNISETSFAGGTIPEACIEGFGYNGIVRLVSPVVDLSGADTLIISFRHFADKNLLPAPMLGLATRTQNFWHSVWETTLEDDRGPEEIELLLTNDDMGSQSFQFSFYITGDMDGLDYWYLDDVVLYYPTNPDCKMKIILTPEYITGPEPVVGKITNLGNTIVDEVDVSFESYLGNVYDSTFSDLNLGLFESYVFKFDRKWISPFYEHELKTWINSVDGEEDWNLENDTATKIIIYDFQPFPFWPCFEPFCNNDCGICAEFDNLFIPWCENHPDIVVVKYVMNPDPYYTNDVLFRIRYYNLDFAPQTFCNGIVAANVGIDEIQLAYDSAVRQSPYEIVSTYHLNGTKIHIYTNILPYQSSYNTNIYSFVVEKVTTGNVGLSGQTEFHNVMMKILPDAHGELVNLHRLLPYTQVISYDLEDTNIEEYDDLLVSVIIQEKTTRKMLQTHFSKEDTLYSSESHLNMITLDGVPLAGFNPDVYEYNVILPKSTVESPVVEGEPVDDGALVVTQQAFLLPNSASLVVYPADRGSFLSYTVYFEISTHIDETKNETVHIHPNPVRDKLFIEGANGNSVILYSINGKQVIFIEDCSDNFISLSGLKKGIYILSVFNGKEKLSTNKVILM